MTNGPPLHTFIYGDTAFGSTAARNNIRDLTTWRPALDRPVYATYVRCTSALDEWVNTHTNAKGNPTVTGYDGPAWTDVLPFDFDAKDADLGTALADARTFIHHLSTWYEVDATSLRLFYSGGRSIHIEIPAALFGVFMPAACPTFTRRLRRIVQVLTRDLNLPTLDPQMYSRMRLWRLEGSRHKEGLYKIALTPEEILSLDAPAIQDLARESRCFEHLPFDEHRPIPGLVALRESVEAAPEPERQKRQADGTDREAGERRRVDEDAPWWSLAVAVLVAVWPKTGRNSAALALGGALAHAGWAATSIENFIADVTIEAMGAEGEARGQTGEWKRIAENSVKKVDDGEDVVGWPTLARIVGNAAVDSARRIIEPQATIETEDDESDDGRPRKGATDDAARPGAEPRTLAEVIATFHRWLYLEDDGLILFVLALIAANMRDGDPTWGMVVGGSSAGKTEPLIASAGLAHVHLVGTIASEGALLSGVTRKDRAKDATGGPLRKVGEFGILLLKDFTSIISMQRDARASVLAALREIHDGSWTRNVGADGGRELSWTGKLGIVAACTTAIDTAHSVSGLLGERFIYYRLPEYDRQAQGLQAIGNLRHTEQMRQEMAGAVLGLFAALDPAAPLPELTPAEAKRFVALADLAALCRTGVDRDPRSRDLELIPDPEGPARLAGTLARLYDGMRAIGVEEAEAWRIVQKVAFDSIPKVRRGVFDMLRTVGPAEWIPTPAIATSIGYPTTTARRSLEDLSVHGVAHRRSGTGAGAKSAPAKGATAKGGGKPPDEWQLSPRARTLLAEGFVPEMSDIATSDGGADGPLNQPLPRVGDISGTNPPDVPLPLWSEFDQDEAGARSSGCWRCKAGVAEDSAVTCDACGWLVCDTCGACAEDCSSAVEEGEGEGEADEPDGRERWEAAFGDQVHLVDPSPGGSRCRRCGEREALSTSNLCEDCLAGVVRGGD